MGILVKLLILIFLLSISTTGSVWAQDGTKSAQPTNPFEKLRNVFQEKKETVQEKRQETREKIQTKTEDAKEARLAKLDAAKLRVCEGKEKVLTNRLSSLTRTTGNMLEKFDAIATRVKDFYTNKIVPAGGSVANYEALLADIDAKKAAVDAALALATANSGEFTCDGDDPKGVLAGFREDMQAVKQALGDYRTAIKDLIVAVKSSASVLRTEKETENE